VILLGAGWVLPVGEPPIREGRVAVEAGRVSWVGARGGPGLPEGRLHHLGPGVLMPGLVNAHCHLELSHLRGRLPRDAGFVGWVEALVAARGTHAEAEIASASTAAIAELEACGTVAVADVSNSLQPVAGLRAGRLRALVLHELLGWDPAAARRVLDEARARVADLDGGRVTVRLAAHAPHSVSPELLALLAEGGGPAAIHLAESPDEVAFLRHGDGAWGAFLERRGLGHVRFDPPRVSPVAYLEARGALHPRLIAAHCVQAGADDLGLLARRGVHVAVCPRSNAALGVGLPPLPAMLAAGVKVCAGTDSLASVETLNVLDDVAALHRAFPAVPAATLVAIATVNGARALGFDDLGTIAPGMAAALAYARADAPPADPEGFVVSGEARLRPVAV
jgi:cytosine/adenosine deaminase-related metal-dependent hydrolase